MPPVSGVKLSCHRVDGAAGRVGGRPWRRGPSRRCRCGPPCPPCCRRAASPWRPGRPHRGQVRVAGLLAPVHDAHAQHRPAPAPQRTRPSPAAGSSRPCGRTCSVSDGRDREDREHLDEVGERRRVLERVRGVGVEEAAAVRAQFLDRSPARRQGPGAMTCAAPSSVVDLGRRVEVLHDALGDEDERADDADRQQDVENAAREVDPEVAELARRTARQAADEARSRPPCRPPPTRSSARVSASICVR